MSLFDNLKENKEFHRAHIRSAISFLRESRRLSTCPHHQAQAKALEVSIPKKIKAWRDREYLDIQYRNQKENDMETATQRDKEVMDYLSIRRENEEYQVTAIFYDGSEEYLRGYFETVKEARQWCKENYLGIEVQRD